MDEKVVVEYLIIVKQEDDFCNSAKAFLSFLAIDGCLKILEENNTITMCYEDENKFTVSYSLLSDLLPSKKERYFKLQLTSNEKNQLNEFDKLTNRLEKIFRKLHTEIRINILWSDVARQYAIQGYGLINEVENLVRRLIEDFMAINVGWDWYKYHIPVEVSNRETHLKDTDSDYLHSVYFSDLKTILFKGQRDFNFRNIEDIQKFVERRISEKKTAISIEDFQGVISKSLWEKHFSKVTEYKKSDLESDLEKLNGLRNQIAHNRHINRQTLGMIQNISKKIIKTLKLEIDNLPNNKLTPEEQKYQVEIILSDFIQKVSEKTSVFSEDDADDLINNEIGNTTYIKSLFSNNHLHNGDIVYYNPAKEQTGSTFSAIIKREGASRCLSIEGDDKFYSFSGLRKKIVADLDLKGINPFWGFNLWNEWTTDKGTPLSSLSNFIE